MYQVTHIHVQPAFTVAPAMGACVELVELDVLDLRRVSGGVAAADVESTDLPYRGWDSGGHDALPYRGW